ncbi:MAG TPA: thioredoxin family protein, partial [Variovorax sp.]
FIVDPGGTLVYAGGIDSIASAGVEDIGTATNYVNQALDEAFGGRPINAALTRPHGSAINYQV